MMSQGLAPDHRFFERYRYAIIDASRREEVPEHWPAQPIAPAFLKDDTARCPLLVDFFGVPEIERNELLDRMAADMTSRHEVLISLALASSLSSQRLRHHLAQRLEIRLSPGEEPRQFRYFDPGTFIQFPDVIGNSGISWLLGPIEAVAVPWLGEWRCYVNPGDATTAFNLTHHHDALLGFSIVNRVLTQLDGIKDQNEWREKGKTLRNIVGYARSTYGLSLRDDLVAFAMHALHRHPAFDRHPMLQKLLAELAAAVPEDELDYRELTARLEEDDWQRITQDMQAATTAGGVRP